VEVDFRDTLHFRWRPHQVQLKCPKKLLVLYLNSFDSFTHYFIQHFCNYSEATPYRLKPYYTLIVEDKYLKVTITCIRNRLHMTKEGYWLRYFISTDFSVIKTKTHLVSIRITFFLYCNLEGLTWPNVSGVVYDAQASATLSPEVSVFYTDPLLEPGRELVKRLVQQKAFIYGKVTHRVECDGSWGSFTDLFVFFNLWIKMD
jgi:hypothetical protein